MNREIKFRAWDKEEKEMINVARIDIADGSCYSHIFNGNALDYWNNVKLMQYTGLKDVNGKEIFEGDIIEGGYLNPLTGEFLSRKYIVEYENAQFRGKLIGHSPYGDTWLHFIKGKVIGNIYENPELLEE